MNPRASNAWIETDYPAVRRIMGAQRERLDDEALEDMLGELFPESDPADVEDFMRSVQRFGKQAAPLAQRALPGMIQGATTGATVAGPWGAVAGAIGGGITSVARGAPAPARAAPAAPPAPPSAGPAPLPGPAAGAEPAAPNAPAAQLLALLSRPETMQALLALLMANAGRPAVRVGDQSIPAAAFANAISELAAETAAAFDGPAREDISDYLRDAHGDPRADVMNPAERAALLLEELARVAEEEGEDDGYDEDDEDDEEDFNDD